ncbi:MAG: double-strand break repair protein AddB, partial [Pseudomonadota bacterium]
TATMPQILAERGLVDPATQRAAALNEQAARYAATGSRGPVIAAGSTGSIPATAKLLKAIAQLDQGCVVLPGLDRDLDEETFAKVDLPDNDRDDTGTAATHPQFGLRRLLTTFGLHRNDIHHIGSVEHGPIRVRETIVSQAMRPAETTDRWAEFIASTSDDQRTTALEGVALVEAPGEREEALAIALALRETLETAEARCALVTPDRNLARRVAVEMRRFGVNVDDSAGLPLDNRVAGTFARLVVRQAFGKADPNVSVALYKHPLSRFSRNAIDMRRAADAVEVAALRGAIEPLKNGTLSENMRRARKRANDDKHVHAAVARLTDDHWMEAVDLAETIDNTFDMRIWGALGTNPSVADLARRSLDLVKGCAEDDEGAVGHLLERSSGEALDLFFEELIETGTDLHVAQSQWPDVFDALMAGRTVRPNSGTHPRVTILGPLEARLQSFDRIVLGGLNEGTWPGTGGNDPFLSRPMKGQLALPTPERRTGLAAHDVTQALGHRDIVLTRSQRTGDAPTVASRWVQRLKTVAGEQARAAMQNAGNKYLDWAGQLDSPAAQVAPAQQPKPCPAVHLRPKRLSVTQVPTLIADPFAIYAAHVLKLEPLPDLAREADHRERGTLFHKIAEHYVVEGGGPREAFLEVGLREFRETALPSEVEARWWPRIVQIADAFTPWHESEVKPSVTNFLPELRGEIAVREGFDLSGIADRFDVAPDGSFHLWDYKTTENPKSMKSVVDHQAPQLPLLAAMAVRGAFSGITGPVSLIGYIRLIGQGKFGQISIDGENEPPPADIAEQTWAALERLIAHYAQPSTPYISKARYIEDEPYANPYDHLARVAEWSVQGDAPEGEA